MIRYNGKHPSEHTNKLEKEQQYEEYKFGPAFHIHIATERYQESGYYPIDGFAFVTANYYDFNSALSCFLKENNFEKPQSPQSEIFEGIFV